MSLQEFFAMGGYAAFVWPSYAVTLLVLVGNVWLARSAHRRAREDALRRAAREEGRS
jgi:heme exporter protein D